MRLFLSYSRQEFYFADSTAISLQREGHDIWFDVQRLSPGSNWKESIEAGLAECEGVLLIASRSSLASKYVQTEWDAALTKDKPLYVLAYEPVELPPNLRATTIINGRGNFERAIKRLDYCIEQGKPYNDSIPRPSVFNRLPGPILLLAALILFNGVFAGLGLIDILGSIIRSELAGSALVGILIYIALAVSSFTVLVHLVQRRFSRIEYFSLFLVTWILLLLYGANSYGNDVSNVACFWLLYVVFPMAAFLSPGLRLWMYHWLPRGSAEEGVRQHYQEYFKAEPGKHPAAIALADISIEMWRRWVQELSLKGVPVPAEGQRICYRLYYAPADQAVADQLEVTMRHFRHTPASEGKPADQQFLIVSNQTPKGLLDKMSASPQPMTVVIASSVTIDEGALFRYQMVDYRGRSQKQLNAVAGYFANPEAGRLAYGLNHLPRPFEWRVTPTSVAIAALVMRLFGAFFIAFAVIVLLTLIVPLNSRFAPETDLFSLLLYGLLGLCGIPLIRLSDDLIERKMAGRTFNRVMGALLIGIGTLLGLISLRDQEILKGFGSLAQGITEAFDQWYVGVIVILGSIFPLAKRFRLWLPSLKEATPAEQQLAAHNVPYLWLGLRDVVILVVVLGMLVFRAP
jgi:hypothetical protein